jgi:hypothetical protein
VIIIILCVIVWFGCGVIGAGLMFPYWQGKYPMIAKEEYGQDRRDICFEIPAGLVGLISDMLWLYSMLGKEMFKYGWRLK